MTGEPPAAGAHPQGPPDRRIFYLTAFLAILLPTLYFKHANLTSLYRGGLPVLLKSAVAHPSWTQLELYRLAFFSRDILEVLAGCCLLFTVLFLAARAHAGAAISVLVACALAVIGANNLSFTQLQSYLTPDTIRICAEWIASNPGILRSYVTWPMLLVLPLIPAWSALPALALRISRRHAPLRRVASAAFLPGTAALAAGSALLFLSAHYAFGGRSAPLWGYWSQTATSLLFPVEAEHPPAPLLALSDLKAQYESLAYPAGTARDGGRILALDPAVLRQRHIVVIALETAPRAYYPILDNPAMPGFYARRGESIVSEHHYTPRPYTTWADYALLTGVYPRIGREAGGRERGQAEGLAAILARHGYLTTYIDSYRIDWHGGDRHRTMWRQLGFQTLIDTTDDPPPQAPDPYEADLGRERRSLARALDALDDAQRRGRKAFVFVGTLFGHFDWKARPGDEDLPAAEKILRNCRAIDGVITEFVSAVGKRGLGDDLLLLVTGDHGLRSDAEFASLGETMMIGRASFNVPFALYAPGVIDSETVLPYPTSHVDVAPTLLELTGLSEPEAFFHGESMLENHLRDRVLFQLNSGLTPTDGYLWHERFFTSNHLTGVVEVGREADAADPAFENSTAGDAAIPAALRDPRAELARFRDYLNAVGRYFETLGAAGSAASPSG